MLVVCCGAPGRNGGGAEPGPEAWASSATRRGGGHQGGEGSEPVSDAQADPDERPIVVGDVDVPVGEDAQLEMALGDPVHSHPRRDYEIHPGAAVGNEEAHLEADTEGDGPGGGVERGADQRAPERDVRVGDVIPAQVDPVELLGPVRGGQSGEEGCSQLRARGDNDPSAVRGDGETAEPTGPRDIAPLADFRTFGPGRRAALLRRRRPRGGWPRTPPASAPRSSSLVPLPGAANETPRRHCPRSPAAGQGSAWCFDERRGRRFSRPHGARSPSGKVVRGAGPPRGDLRLPTGAPECSHRPPVPLPG